MRFAHRLDRLLDLVVGRRLGFDDRTVRLVITEVDVGLHDHGRRVLERLPGLKLAHRDAGVVDRRDVLELDDLPVRLVDHVLGSLSPEVFGAVLALVHRARCFARTEPADARLLVVALEDTICLACKAVRVRLDLEHDARARLPLHGVTEGALRGRGRRGGIGHGMRLV